MGLDKNQLITQVIAPALKKVADFTGDPSNFPTADFQKLHKSAFIIALQQHLAKVPVEDDGTTYPDLAYNVTLNEGMFDDWTTIDDVTNYILENVAVG